MKSALYLIGIVVFTGLLIFAAYKVFMPPVTHISINIDTGVVTTDGKVPEGWIKAGGGQIIDERDVEADVRIYPVANVPHTGQQPCSREGGWSTSGTPCTNK